MPRTMQRDADAYAEVYRRSRAVGPIANAQKLAEVIAPYAERQVQEVLLVVPLDVHGYMLEPVEVHRGTIDSVNVEPRDVLQAMPRGARYFILVHNHPSGDARPSDADIELTGVIAEGAACAGYVMLDHVVLGMREFYSFAEDQGLG